MPPRKKVEPPKDANLVTSKQPCPFCPSSDAFAVYDDGHGFCFAEGKLYSARQLKEAGWDMGAAGNTPRTIAPEGPSAEIEQFIATAKPHPLKTRNLTLATCKRWDYRVRKNTRKGTYEQLALYRDKTGKVVDVKVRTEDKDFFWLSGKQHITLYGQHMWGSGGKYLVITEGEIDAMTVSQAFDHKYPVVSVPGGAAGAAKAIAGQLEWINSFDKIVFMFDMDQPGQDAAKECAAMVAPGKAFIAWLPEKDPNELLKLGREEEITKAFWDAKKFAVGGVVDARTLTIRCKQKIEVGRPWPWKFLTRWTFGRRPGEAIYWLAGIGIGKSDILAQIAASTILGKTEEGVAYAPSPLAVFNFEAEDWKTKLLIAGKLARRRFHIPNMPEFDFDAGWTEEERDRTLDLMDSSIWDNGGRLYLNEGGYTAEWEDVVSRMRYLNKAEGVHEFVVDNIAAIVADMNESDERVFLDQMARQTKSLSLEMNATIQVVSHCKRPGFGPPHEEGGKVSLAQARGSHGIGIAADYAFGIERNKMAEDPMERLVSTIRCLKDRPTGLSDGLTSKLIYDPMGGTLDAPVEGANGI